jgi:precorrin-2 dehydrogenase/sirohydrochlorin ferrochelatase
MALFPMFVDIEGKNILIVGAGEVALRKIEKLIPFKPKLTVVAKEIVREEIKKLAEENNIHLIERNFLFTDIDGKEIVIVAVDDINLQREIYNYCVRRKIPVNSVDSPNYCTFIFPAYVKRGDIVVGITTSGNAPGLSGRLRKLIENYLPEDLENILDELIKIRESMPKGEERQEVIKKLVEEKLKDKDL